MLPLPNFHHWLPIPAGQRFLLAGVFFLAAATARLTLPPLDISLSYLIFYPGLALAIVLCGTGPSFFFIALSALGGVCFDWYPPLTPETLVPAVKGAVFFIASSLLALFLVGALQRYARGLRRGSQESAEPLVQEETWLAGVVNSAMDAIVSVDSDHRIMVFNPAAERMFGYQAGEVLGLELGRLIPEQVAVAHATWMGNFSHAGQSGRPMGSLGNLCARRRDGSEFPIEASISQGTVNGIKIFTVIMRDITERTLVRQALADHEERFRAFMAHSPLASWLVDADGCLQYVNPVFYTMFGVASGDVLGKPAAEIFPADLAEEQLRNNRRVIDSGQPLEVVEKGLRTDGSPGAFLVFKFSITNAAGKTLVCANALDITERQRIEVQLVDTNKRLSMITEAQAAHLRSLAGELTQVEQNERDELAEMLHDHVQPLLIAARLALSGLDKNQPLVTWEQVVQKVSGHISAAIDMARSLSVELNPPLVRERGLGVALEWQGRRMAAAHGIAIGVFCDPVAEPEDPEIRMLCFKGVRELLMNAIKHSGAKRVEVDMMLDGEDTLRITVTDLGRGFDPEALYGPAAISHGSGLAGIERRLGMIGGRLLIDSSPGAGSSMTMLVPLPKGRRFPPHPLAAEIRTRDRAV